MKRVLCLILTICMLFCVTAFSENKLDALFESGSASLTEIPLWTAETYTMAVSQNADLSQMGDPADIPAPVFTDDQKKLSYYEIGSEVLEELKSTAMPISISPDGAVFFVNGERLFVVRENVITPILYSPSRGAEDVHGNMKQYQSSLRRICSEQIVWSPDGRYAIISPFDYLTQFGVLLDLVIMDTHTGEMFLAVTYSSKLRSGGGGVPLAAFDHTGQYVYYMLYGTVYEERFSLVRYDLNTGETTLIAPAKGMLPQRPALAETARGSWLCLLSERGSDTCIYEFKTGLFKWKTEAHPIDASLGLIPREVQSRVTGKSETILVYFNNMQNTACLCPSAFSVFDGSLKDINTLWAIPVKNAGSAVQVDIGVYEQFSGNAAQEYLNISRMRISPCGKYALAFGYIEKECAFYLIRLSDMAFVKVDAPASIANSTAVINANRMPVFTSQFVWYEDGRILAIDESNIVHAYSLN